MSVPTNEMAKYMDKYSKEMKDDLTKEQLQKLDELKQVVEQSAPGNQKEVAFEKWVNEALQFTIGAFHKVGAEKNNKKNNKKKGSNASDIK